MGYDLYVVTDEKIGRGRSHAELARQAVAGGADAVQLRDKNLSGRDLFAAALAIREITSDAGALFIVNDRLDVALAAGADGVHLGAGDLPIGRARRIAPPGFIIGASVGSTATAARAAAEGADYVALSPTFATNSKDDAGPGHGLAMLAAVRAAVPLPLVAIGGITVANIADVIAVGADGVAVISAVVGKDDVTAAARDLRARIAAAKAKRR
ncbi:MULTISPECIES: thiamine phosphate synthase [unclassified Methanoculleus]|uniref:thiamine phosphate synthase n=1 Tax=unclassified Methanoculleus TaxID=2619537 RepID=UPI0025F32523|nr:MULTISPECIES: thiamine phosphate synthase [unclassified Methanoculleus]MCK9317380.1 thiamine phosphate synthase [Methanoculleus sp.]MDD2253450.1 thiamine phosphate synthase [Methanoculleus sp.]MDD2788164.1 thiamine phosphate synthase [Methanoculleus sp.]MDD3215434.1 thiamine phosphate synthase [Methanoculleus sp.]MDD4314280.1 thiamine phosphate synthase [Methanoculleus sp.]